MSGSGVATGDLAYRTGRPCDWFLGRFQREVVGSHCKGVFIKFVKRCNIQIFIPISSLSGIFPYNWSIFMVKCS